jgi:hypothetical protein
MSWFVKWEQSTEVDMFGVVTTVKANSSIWKNSNIVAGTMCWMGEAKLCLLSHVRSGLGLVLF